MQHEEGDITERLRAELVLSPGGHPDVAALAAALKVSPRTMRRKMLAAGCSYRTLLSEARYRDAGHFLEASDLDLKAIAERLDFGDPANFTGAIRRWAQQTPSAFRESRKWGEGG